MIMLLYMSEYVDGIDEEALEEDYKTFYRAVKNGDPNMYLLLDRLRCDLIQKGILPALHTHG